MSAVCRICLASNTTLHSLKNNQLLDIYKRLSDCKFNAEDARPRIICPPCYRKLQRCHTFSQMTDRSEKIFNHLYDKGLEVTHDHITQVNLEMIQRLPEDTMQCIPIDDHPTNAGPRVTVKHETSSLDIKEEVTTEQDTLLEVDSVPDDDTEMIQRLPEDTIQCITIDDNPTNAGPRVTVKHETSSLDIKEEVTTEPDTLLEVDSVPDDDTEIIQRLPEDTIQCITIDDNAANAGPRVTVKHEPSSVDIKEEVTTEQDSLLEVNVPDDGTERQLKLEDDIDQDNDEKEVPSNIYTERTKPDNTNMPFSCNNKDKIINNQKNMPFSYNNKDEIINNQKKQFACSLCDKSFNFKGNLVQHMRIHTGEKPFACGVCHKPFNEKSSFVQHMRIHTGQKPFACSVCDKAFLHKSNLVIHKRIHTGDKPLTCSVCDKTFKCNSRLVRHMRAHTKEKPFVCSVCHKPFNKKSRFVQHMRTHTGQRPFACSVCDKAFKHKSHLVIHKRIHTGEKPFVCSVCDKSYIRRSSLGTHMRTHKGVKPISCNVCDKSFDDKVNFVEHMKTHTGDEPFACSVCNKPFKHKCNLVIHMRIHTGEKPFACSVCDKSFNHRGNLGNHMRIHQNK